MLKEARGDGSLKQQFGNDFSLKRSRNLNNNTQEHYLFGTKRKLPI